MAVEEIIKKGCLLSFILAVAFICQTPKTEALSKTSDISTGKGGGVKNTGLTEEIEALEKEIKGLRHSIRSLERTLQSTENLIDENNKFRDYSLSKIKLLPGTVETIIEPENNGWAANQLFTPELMSYNGENYLLFGTQQDNPGKTGIGYVRLDASGKPDRGTRKPLVIKTGYKRIESPLFISGARSSNPKPFIYSSEYYITRVGEWAWYITRRALFQQEEKLKVSAPETILTGSGQPGDWRARGASLPAITTVDSEPRLFFRAKTWPKSGNDRLNSLGWINPTKPGDVSGPLADPVTGDPIWRDRIRGLEVIGLDDRLCLVFATLYRRGSEKSSIEVTLFKDNYPAVNKVLIRDAELRQNLPKPLLSDIKSSVLGEGLDLIKINGDPYLYFTIRQANKKQAIYRAELNLPEPFKGQIPEFRKK